MSRRSTRTIGRIARTAAVALAAGVVLAGCSMSVEGVPHAAPAPTRPVSVAPSPAALVEPAEPGDLPSAYLEWIADGWVPQPILPVIDPDSGVSAWLIGPAEPQEIEGGGTLYTSYGAPASVVHQLAVVPEAPGDADAERTAAILASERGGWVVDSEPITMLGHPGLDVRMEFFDDLGRPCVALTRFVELPRHIAAVESLGLVTDERVVEQVQEIVADQLSLPTT